MCLVVSVCCKIVVSWNGFVRTSIGRCFSIRPEESDYSGPSRQCKHHVLVDWSNFVEWLSPFECETSAEHRANRKRRSDVRHVHCINWSFWRRIGRRRVRVSLHGQSNGSPRHRHRDHRRWSLDRRYRKTEAVVELCTSPICGSIVHGSDHSRLDCASNENRMSFWLIDGSSRTTYGASMKYDDRLFRCRFKIGNQTIDVETEFFLVPIPIFAYFESNRLQNRFMVA